MKTRRNILKLAFLLIFLVGIAVASCPNSVKCSIDGQYMFEEETYVSGSHMSKKYGHDYYGSHGTEHHYVIVQCD